MMEPCFIVRLLGLVPYPERCAIRPVVHQGHTAECTTTAIQARHVDMAHVGIGRANRPVGSR